MIEVRPNTTTTATVTVTRLFMSIPEGRLRRKVKEIAGVPSFPDEAHPNRKHRWHEMPYHGRPGTGFVECRCGAVGISAARR